jgi:WD40 repeat protein
VSAVSCHPGGKSCFVTAGDDSFMNVWEVSSSKDNGFEIKLLHSSRVPDYQITGVAFGKKSFNSVVAAVYDYRSILVWDDLL